MPGLKERRLVDRLKSTEFSSSSGDLGVVSDQGKEGLDEDRGGLMVADSAADLTAGMVFLMNSDRVILCCMSAMC